MDTGSDASTPSSPGPDATPPRSIPSASSIVGGDWPAQAADAIVNAVETVRDRTTTPIMKVARGLVFGVFAGTIIITIVVLAIIGLVRILGVVFTTIGALLFRRRNAPAPTPAVGSSSKR